MLVNLAGISVLPQQSSEYPLPSHPLDLGRHTSLGSTLSLTGTGVPAFSLGSEEFSCAGTGVDDSGLDDDMAILDELGDVFA